MMHTPEPWAIDPDERADMEWNNHILGATGERICFMAHDGTPTNAAGEANAARIVACVNALAGIPTDKLRPGIVKELIEASVQLMRLHPASSGQPRRGPIVEIENGMRALLRELGSE